MDVLISFFKALDKIDFFGTSTPEFHIAFDEVEYKKARFIGAQEIQPKNVLGQAEKFFKQVFDIREVKYDIVAPQKEYKESENEILYDKLRFKVAKTSELGKLAAYTKLAPNESPRPELQCTK